MSSTHLTFRKHVSDMKEAATESLTPALPDDVRDKILESTGYGFPDRVIQNINFFKDEYGEELFFSITYALSTREVVNFGQHYMVVKPLRGYPEWLFDILNQFIDLLKLTPELPPILIPLKGIITNFVPELIPHERHLDHEFEYSDQHFTQTCNQMIIEPFMRSVAEGGLDPNSETFLRIQQFLKNVVQILIKFMDVNKEQIESQFMLRPDVRRIPCYNNGLCSVRNTIQNTFTYNVFPFLEALFLLHERKENPDFFKNINFNEWIKYAKIQNAFYKELLKKEHRDYYKQWKDDWDDWNGELRTLYQTQDDELYAKKAAQAKGGRKQKKRSIRTNKRHNSKKRAYKKRSYKNKK